MSEPEKFTSEWFSEIGKKGAASTNSKMSKDQLSRKMSKAAKARWEKHKKSR